MKDRIAVVGASGFVGTSLVERLLAEGRHEVRPLIHSTGNAWRLARYGLELRRVDLLSETEVRAALEGCTHVVNCSRGPDEVMTKGLRNLLRASRLAGVTRFVHLSSVAVYGEPPPPESVHEDPRPRPIPGTYGWIKLQQDHMVYAACERGLPSVILCPPNISGAYSFFLVGVLSAIQEGRLALVDGGKTPCNLVDVQNLAKAIMLALVCQKTEGTRIFITDDEEITWLDVAEALAPLADRNLPPPVITRPEVLAMTTADAKPRLSVLRTVQHLGSRGVRSVLRQDPLLAKIEQGVSALVRIFPNGVRERLRMWANRPIIAQNVEANPTYDTYLCTIQLRGVRHSCERAKQVLGYTPDYSFKESMDVFRTWYEATQGYEGHGLLLKEL